jgi:hypothetical protein
MRWLILLEILLALLGGLAFVVLYALRSPWRSSPMGRHVMAFMLVTVGELAALLALGLGLSVPLWLFAVGFAALDAVVLQRLVLLWRAQHIE